MHPRRLIRRHFLEGLGDLEGEKLRAHLRQCPSCRREYDRLALLLRVVAERPQTRAETDRLWRTLRAGLDGPAPRRPARRWARLAPAALAVGLVPLVAGLLLVYRPRLPESQTAWRGGAAAPIVDLEVFAIREEAPGRLPRTRLVPDGGTLLLDELVQFRYLSPDPGRRYLYLLGVDDSLEPLDYFPRPHGGQSIGIQPSLAMTPIERSIRLSARHRPGGLRVIALFSPRPLQRAEVHATLARLRLRGVNPDLSGTIDWGKNVVSVVRRFQVENQGR